MIYKTIADFNQKNSNNIGIVIGNFDGVHSGHRQLLLSFEEKCKTENVEPVLITFSPHPYLFIKKETKNFLINSRKQKLHLLEKLGFDTVIELDFDSNLMSMSAINFIDEHLLQLKNLSLIYLGHDFSLGSGKEPARDLLKDKIKNRPIKIFEAQSYTLEAEVISSTLVRNKLNSEPIEKINDFLGYNYFLMDQVINGYGVGKKELVPTANIKLDPIQKYPRNGVYFTQCEIDGKLYSSITNIGIRPSLEDEGGLSIETNIFGFNQDLYEKELKVYFLKFHRAEKKFNSKEELLEQIQLDIKTCKEFHA